MASEILQRNPTSTGNRRVFTWAGWIKFNKLSSTSNCIWYAASSGGSEFNISLVSSTARLNVYDYASSAYQYQYQTNRALRDFSNWFHLVVAVDTTHNREDDRFKIYVNGVLYNGSYATETVNSGINYNTRMNTPGEINYIGQNVAGGSAYDANCELTDLFLVDGQALTPDVFGFYKEGKGYQSSGSIQSTDFRPGQWSPHSPRKIKTEIERRGGFGVNGFYLPMNDSSNFGADFHCTPDSIITLKGEDLPQPRNGAPTTSDAYVSQLRSDPYAANLVLAVPGISTATGANLVTNGTFDTNTTGWTSEASATLSSDNGRLKVLTTNTSYGSANQVVTGLTIGQRYTFQVDMIYGNASLVSVIDQTAYGGSVNQLSGWQSADYVWRTSFVADATSLKIDFQMASQSNVYGFWDNVILKAEDAPRDYSADIKGSGTNKTLTSYDNAGVGYEIPSYYGSAMNFDGATDYMATTLSAMGTNDFTIEFWVYPKAISGSYVGPIGLTAATTVKRIELAFQSGTLQIYTDTGSWRDTGFAPPTNQWTHIALEKYNGYLTAYANGVAVWTVTNTRNYDESYNVKIGKHVNTLNGYMQDIRVYNGVAKYKGGFDVPKPYAPVGIENWRAIPDTCKNNFATLNSLEQSNGSTSFTFSEGNTRIVFGGSSYNTVYSTVGVTTGKYYFECRYNTEYVSPGVGANNANPTLRIDNGLIYYNGVLTETPSPQQTQAVGQIYGIALDRTNSSVQFYLNGSTYGSAQSISASNKEVFAHIMSQNSTQSSDSSWNFGQNPSFGGRVTAGTYTDGNGKGLFKYQPPTGYLALCEDNLPTPAIADPGEHFKTVLYTGTGSSRSVTGVGFKPDLVWIKERNSTSSHEIFNSVVGPTYKLNSNTTNAESANTGALRSFDSDGFSLGDGGAVNENASRDYVAWCWKAGGAAVSNTDGSITSQVSVNQDAGFSIVSYTSPNNASDQTVGHGLNKKPDFIIVKDRDFTYNWDIYHSSLGYNASLIFTTAATRSGAFGAEPTSSVFTTKTTYTHNSTDKYIAYCWTEIEGFSKFGTYSGNGIVDGPFVYCGFKPAWVMIKPYGSGNGCYTGGYTSWSIYDSSRSPINDDSMHERVLFANRNYEEGKRGNGASSGNFQNLDFVSNGFKIRGQSNCETNTTSINGFLFAAFAESPFQTANAK